MSKIISVVSVLLSVVFFNSSALAAGNRYGLEQHYKSEISPAKSFLVTTRDHGERDDRHDNSYKRGEHNKAIIVDVRTIEEYVGGHPLGSYSIPFPHIYNRQHNPAKGDYIPANAEDFVAAVNALDLPKDTLIITMCRTGFRSVLAANLLVAEGYTNVRNMWEGFKGTAKVDTNGNKEDLNNDGVVDDSNPYSGDLDGWANYQELPVSFRLKANRLFAPYASMYYNVTGER